MSRKAPSTAFKPGQSGNPAGRKPLPADIKALAAKYAPDAFRAIVEISQDKAHPQRLAAAKEVCDRAWGKPVQAIENGPDSAPFLIKIVRLEDDAQ